MTAERNSKLRSLNAGYSDTIRLSDIKANIAVLFAWMLTLGAAAILLFATRV